MRNIYIILSLLLLCAMAAFGQAALVGHGYVQGTTTPVTVPASGSINMTGANFIHVCAATNGLPPVVSDSSGNVYQTVQNVGLAGYGQPMYSFFVAGPTVTSAMTFTVTNSTAAEVSGFSGVASGPDQQSQNSNRYFNSLPSGNMTPTNANELVTSCFGTGISYTMAVNSPLTLLEGSGAPSFSEPGIFFGYQIQGGSATAVNPTWVTSPNTNYTAGGIISETYYSQLSPATLAITTTNLPEGFVSTPYSGAGSVSSMYSNQLTYTGGEGGPYTWTITAGTLPTGLSMASSGLITGTPTTAHAAVNVTFQVADAYSHTASATFPITITATTLSLGPGTCTGSNLLGTQYAAYVGCTLAIAGGASPTTVYQATPTTFISNTSDTIPEGLTINSTTGAISGTIYGQGAYQPTFIYQDSLGSYAAILTSGSPVVFQIAGKNMNSGCLPMTGSIFSTRVDSLPVDTSPAAPVNSAYLTSPIIVDGGNLTQPGGIPFGIVPYNQATNPVTPAWPGYTIQNTFPPYSVLAPSSPNGGCFSVSAQATGSVAIITTNYCSGSGIPAIGDSVYMTGFVGGSLTGLNYNTYTVLSSGYSSTTFEVSFSGAAGPPYGQNDLSATASEPYPGYGPIPSYNPIEDSANGIGQDQHTIVVQEAGGGNPCQEFDQWGGSTWTGTGWTNLATLWLPNLGTTGTNPLVMNFQGNGQTDAAGLPIAPLLLNAEEVNGTGTPTSPNGVVQHVIRMTLDPHPMDVHVWPAVGQNTTYLGCTGGYYDGNGLIVQPNSGPNQPPTTCGGESMPYGEIYRLKASVYASLPSCFSTSPQSMIIATALAHYGVIVADIGRTGYLTATNDSQWNNSDTYCTAQLKLGDFEPVNVMGIVKHLDGSGLPTVDYATTSTPQSGTPTFSPVAGTYTGTQSVTISATGGSVICYNTTGSPATNGTTGCTTGTLYTSPVSVSASETLYAVSGGTGYTDSSVASAGYTITGTPPPGVAPQLFY